MPIAILQEDRELERDYLLSNGSTITLALDDEYERITFKDSIGRNLEGEFIFVENDDNDKYLLARMYAPIIRQGIGRACLEFFTEVSSAEVYTRPNDGIRLDDGSHLTGDAISFVLKMQEEGLIQQDDYDCFEKNDYEGGYEE